MRHVFSMLLLAAATLAAVPAVAPAGPAPRSLACGSGVGENCRRIVLAQSNCGAVAAAVARQQGGQVIGAPQTVTRGNQTMCVITILIRDPTGQRPPVRKQIMVPAG